MGAAKLLEASSHESRAKGGLALKLTSGTLRATVRSIVRKVERGALEPGIAQALLQATQVLAELGAEEVSPPTSSTSPGIKGQTAHDEEFAYWCVAPNTWRRARLEVW